MLEKLALIKNRWEDIGVQLSESSVISDMKKYTELSKEYKKLKAIVEQYKIYHDLISNIEANKQILSTEKDQELKDMAKEELETLLVQKDPMEEKIRLMLIPQDPQDAKDAILEIRAGTGGNEASLFAGDLLRMYVRYCEKKGWKAETIDVTEGTVGGFKEVILNISGEDVYGTLKYESGVHRVQRVPQTEAQGRVHTSAASVVVLPEADEVDVVIRQEDIRKDTYCSSGPGGQSVNTTYSAIRLTHIPTGIVTTCQDEKSQIKNYEKALKVLRARLYEVEHQKYLDDVAQKRKSMVSTGDRSAKIRTYNFSQSRVSEHRINLTLYNLQDILDGNIQQLLDALQLAENAERMKEGFKLSK